VLDQVAAWFERRTSRAADWPVEEVLAAKGSTTVSVVLPARDEASTIASIVRGIRAELLDRHAVVDELIVMDSDSTDDTARIAADAGADVHAVRSVRPDLGGYAGKGEAIWKSQFVASGDVLVFVDADLTEWGPHFVTGMLGPMLHDTSVVLVKGFYDRLLDDGSGRKSTQGGRVTELVARPLINLRRPELAAVVQPLGGEWAVRRSVFETLSVPVGYGVDIGALLDVHARYSLDAIAQVDLGERAHSHQSVHDLAVMAAQIIETFAKRDGTSRSEADESRLWQYDRTAAPPWRARTVPMAERPPAASVR
jgi:glucosyl-3-phosphoglycerate synthase